MNYSTIKLNDGSRIFSLRCWRKEEDPWW